MNISFLTITFSLVFVVVIQRSQADMYNFVQSPSNITQPIGSVAEFRCQHQSLDAAISWLVNGSLSTRFPNVTRIDSGSVSTLTIPSIPEYNGTVVVCEASIRNAVPPVSQQTPPAILTVIVVEYVPTTTVEPITTAMETTTTMEPVTTTVEATTTVVQVQSTTEAMKPTTNTTNFPTVPSPPVLIIAMEERHVYLCNHSETIFIFWRVNGSRLSVEIFPLSIDDGIESLPGGGRVYTLTIGGRLEHNATTIQCSARLSDGSIATTPSVLFLMQGPLHSVVNLTRRNASIFWEAPFSLNLTNVEPDIVYCVEMYNITCGGRELLISDCNVTETSYTFDVIAPDGYIYEYIVTPRSNVEGAQNGTSKNVTEQFMDLQLSTKGHSFSFINNNESGDDIEELKTRIHLDNKDPEQVYIIDATSYSLLLYPLNGFEEESLLMPTYVARNGSSVMLKVSLPYRRLYNYTVLAHGCEEHSIMEHNELSTHDVQNISVTSPQPGEIRVTGDFIDGSTATGLLTIVISTSEIFYHLTERGSDQLHIEGSIQVVVGGEHSISFFVVEESRLPFNRTASIPKVVTVENGNDVNQPSIEYSLQSNSTGVCITCTFLDSSATDCVAVVHQRISQLSSSGLMNIRSHKFTRSGDTASGCIEGVNTEDYQVGVVGGKNATSETTTTTNIPVTRSTSIVYIIVGIVLLLVIVVTGVIILLLKKRQRKSRALQTALSPENPLSKQTNNYETVLPLGTEAAGVHEGTPLFRVQSDGPATQRSDDSAHAHDATPTSTSLPPYSPPERRGDSTSPPPVPPPRTKDDPNVVAYAETVVSKSATAPPPTEMDKVVYHEVGGTLNAEGQHYTLISDLPTRTSVIPDDPFKTVYSELKPQDPSIVVARKNTSEDSQCSPTTEDTSFTPFTLEHILPEVIPMASKWQALGEALSLDEDRLDEIFTNNETDVDCLRVMLEFYLKRSDLKHSWEEIREARKKVEEKDGGTEELDSTSQRSQEKKLSVADADVSSTRVTVEHGENPPVSPVVPLPVNTISLRTISSDVCSSDHAPTADPAPEQHPSYDGIYVLDDTDFQEKISSDHIEGQSSEKGNQEEVKSVADGDDKFSSPNFKHKPYESQVVSHPIKMFTPHVYKYNTDLSEAQDHSPRPFAYYTDEHQVHDYRTSCPETRDDKTDYKTSIKKTLKIDTQTDSRLPCNEREKDILSRQSTSDKLSDGNRSAYELRAVRQKDKQKPEQGNVTSTLGL